MKRSMLFAVAYRSTAVYVVVMLALTGALERAQW